MDELDESLEPTSTEKKKVNFAEELALQQQRYRNSIAELEKALQARMTPPQADPNELLWRISSALVAPSKTGSFAESMGNVAGTVAKYREDERARALQQQNQAAELAKMKMEVSKGLLGETESQAIQQLTPQLYAVNKETGLPEVNIEVAQQLAGITKDPKYIEAINKQVQRNQAIKLFAGATGTMPGQTISAAQASRLTPELISKIMLADKDVGEIANKQFDNFLGQLTRNIDESKLAVQISELIKNYGPSVLQMPALASIMQRFPSLSTPSAEAPAAGAPAEPTAPAAPVAPAAPAAPVSPAAPTAKTAPKAAAPKVAAQQPSQEMWPKTQQSGLEAGAKKTEEDAATRTSKFIDLAKGAQGRIQTAQGMIELATRNPNAFGVISKPGLGPAILTFLRDGLSAGSFGQIGFKSTEDAIRQIGSKQYSNLPKPQRDAAIQADIDAAREFAAYASKLELEYAQMYLAGSGPVTENERGIVRVMGPGVSESPTVIKTKAKLIELGASKDDELLKAFFNFRDAQGKYASFDDFQRTPEYSDIMNRYDKQFKILRQSMRSDKKPHSSSLDAEIRRRGIE